MHSFNHIFFTFRVWWLWGHTVGTSRACWRCCNAFHLCAEPRAEQSIVFLGKFYRNRVSIIWPLHQTETCLGPHNSQVQYLIIFWLIMVKRVPHWAWRNYIHKTGFGQHVEVITVNGWRTVWSRGGLGNRGDEISVNWENGEKLLSTLSPTSSWKCWQKELLRRKPRAYSHISQSSPKKPTLPSGGGSYLGVPCRSAF